MDTPFSDIIEARRTLLHVPYDAECMAHHYLQKKVNKLVYMYLMCRMHGSSLFTKKS